MYKLTVKANVKQGWEFDDQWFARRTEVFDYLSTKEEYFDALESFDEHNFSKDPSFSIQNGDFTVFYNPNVVLIDNAQIASWAGSEKHKVNGLTVSLNSHYWDMSDEEGDTLYSVPKTSVPEDLEARIVFFRAIYAALAEGFVKGHKSGVRSNQQAISAALGISEGMGSAINRHEQQFHRGV